MGKVLMYTQAHYMLDPTGKVFLQGSATASIGYLQNKRYQKISGQNICRLLTTYLESPSKSRVKKSETQEKRTCKLVVFPPYSFLPALKAWQRQTNVKHKRFFLRRRTKTSASSSRIMTMKCALWNVFVFLFSIEGTRR